VLKGYEAQWTSQQREQCWSSFCDGSANRSALGSSMDRLTQISSLYMKLKLNFSPIYQRIVIHRRRNIST
jgi:hypothetical protein